MTDIVTDKIGTWVGHRCRGCCRFLALLVSGTLVLAGCAHVPPQQQRLVSKPNMQFYDSAMFSSLNRLLTQFESSSASAVGGQSSGGSGSCGSCGD